MDIIVIGGGPSGMMFAYNTAKDGHNVILLEKNEKVGKKLYITGKGRCNVTNFCEPNEFLSNVVVNPKFLYGAIYSFNSQNTYDLIEETGLKLKIERGNRVFPESDKSSDIIKCFKDLCTQNGVNIKLNEEVIDAYKNGEKFVVITNNSKYECDALCVCTGGKSYSATGSTGFGYSLAKKFGHTIVEPKPALCPIKLKDDYIKSIEGLSLKNVELSAFVQNKLIKKEFGEMLFTKDGISGPIALTMSSYINKFENVKLSLDFKPALDENKLEARLLREFEENKNAQIDNVLKNLLPKNLVPIFLKKLCLNEQTKCNSITVVQRKSIIDLLKHFEFDFDRLYGIEYGIITSGGVNVNEINPKTMESKLVKNLFFAGEVIDVDALTGGFNIQIALSTAYLAAKGVN